jgi:putative spermidine/putrescine transport system permease protein/mannopine transport system permease protein
MTSMANETPAAKPPRYWNAARNSAALAFPAFAFLAMFLIVPLLRVVATSFSGKPLSLDNYERIFTSPLYLHVILNTFLMAVVVTAVCLIAAYPLAFAIARARGWLKKLLLIVVLVPLWSSVVIRSYAWMILFQKRGVLNEGLLALGIIDRPLQILQTSTAVQIAMVHILLPFMVLPLVTTMSAVDETFLRAGRILGAGPLRLFLRVYLMLTLPGVTAGCSLVFITSLGFYITPALLGGTKNTMVAVTIEQAVSVFFDWPLASALSTTLLLVTIALYLGYTRLTQGELRGVVG